MIQRATDSYLMRLTMPVEQKGHWHLHHRGVDAPTVREMAALELVVDIVLTPVVNDGRWIVQCPHCGGAQLASPNWARFLCVDCANVAFGGRWLGVEWPDEQLVTAGEAALVARPDILTRNWDPTSETIGALLAENVIHGGLVDVSARTAAGDIGASQEDHMIPEGTPKLSLPRERDTWPALPRAREGQQPAEPWWVE